MKQPAKITLVSYQEPFLAPMGYIGPEVGLESYCF